MPSVVWPFFTLRWIASVSASKSDSFKICYSPQSKKIDQCVERKVMQAPDTPESTRWPLTEQYTSAIYKLDHIWWHVVTHSGDFMAEMDGSKDGPKTLVWNNKPKSPWIETLTEQSLQ